MLPVHDSWLHGHLAVVMHITLCANHECPAWRTQPRMANLPRMANPLPPSTSSATCPCVITHADRSRPTTLSNPLPHLTNPLPPPHSCARMFACLTRGVTRRCAATTPSASARHSTWSFATARWDLQLTPAAVYGSGLVIVEQSRAGDLGFAGWPRSALVLIPSAGPLQVPPCRCCSTFHRMHSIPLPCPPGVRRPGGQEGDVRRPSGATLPLLLVRSISAWLIAWLTA